MSIEETGTLGSRVCAGCGYDLRGLDSERCPECGRAIDARIALPWLRRGDLGIIWALIAMVKLVTFRPALLRNSDWEVGGLHAATIFRLIVVGMAWVAILMLVEMALRDFGGVPQRSAGPPDTSERFWELATLWLAGARSLPVRAVCLGLTLWLLSGTATLWARSERDRVLARYACAPLVWLVVPAALVAAARLLRASGDGFVAASVMVVTYLFLAISLIACAWSAIRLRARERGRGRIRAVSQGAVCVAATIAAIGFGLGALPCIAGLIWIAFDSLRP
ncbi:MAG TPA: hypothetical protein VIM11_11015 [Tepidisphaeraceae bacterium]